MAPAIFSQESRQSRGVKKGGAKTGRKEPLLKLISLGRQKDSPNSLPLKAPLAGTGLHGYKGGQESGYMAKGNGTTKNNLGLK